MVSRCSVSIRWTRWLPVALVAAASFLPAAAQSPCGGVTGIQCPEGQYCRVDDGLCTASGVCTDFPEICPAVCDPVCGCDGAVYDNACEAARAGVSVAHGGECDGGAGPAVRGVIGFADGFRWEPAAADVSFYNVYVQDQAGSSAPWFGECLYAAVPQTELITKGVPAEGDRRLFQITALYPAGEGSLGPCSGRSARRCTCTLPADPGPCDGDFPRWFHNYETGQCELFSWGGCGGNLNNFLTAQECADACLDRCALPAVPGDCQAAVPRFFFDKTSGRCESFVWGGCGGNANNFETRVECVEACGDLCLLPPDSGDCDGICPRWFFNPGTGQCEEFVWGCCGGNLNNFPTQQACQATCVPTTPQPGDP